MQCSLKDRTIKKIKRYCGKPFPILKSNKIVNTIVDKTKIKSAIAPSSVCKIDKTPGLPRILRSLPSASSFF